MSSAAKGVSVPWGKSTDLRSIDGKLSVLGIRLTPGSCVLLVDKLPWLCEHMHGYNFDYNVAVGQVVDLSLLLRSSRLDFLTA